MKKHEKIIKALRKDLELCKSMRTVAATDLIQNWDNYILQASIMVTIAEAALDD